MSKNKNSHIISSPFNLCDVMNDSTNSFSFPKNNMGLASYYWDLTFMSAIPAVRQIWLLKVPNANGSFLNTYHMGIGFTEQNCVCFLLKTGHA